MSNYETPEGRWYREQVEAADAAEGEGRYEESRLADKFSAGEVTFEEVLQLFRDGKVFRPPDRFPGSDKFNEVEADAYGDPFHVLAIPPDAKLTREQYEEIKLARSGYVDDGDPRNAGRTVDAELPPPPPDLPAGSVRMFSVQENGQPLALLMSAGESLYRLQVDPAGWVPAPARWDLAYGRESGGAVQLDVDDIEQLIKSGTLRNLTMDSLAVLHGLMEPGRLLG